MQLQTYKHLSLNLILAEPSTIFKPPVNKVQTHLPQTYSDLTRLSTSGRSAAPSLVCLKFQPPTCPNSRAATFSISSLGQIFERLHLQLRISPPDLRMSAQAQLLTGCTREQASSQIQCLDQILNGPPVVAHRCLKSQVKVLSSRAQVLRTPSGLSSPESLKIPVHSIGVKALNPALHLCILNPKWPSFKF